MAISSEIEEISKGFAKTIRVKAGVPIHSTTDRQEIATSGIALLAMTQ